VYREQPRFLPSASTGVFPGIQQLRFHENALITGNLWRMR
jgi:hypothetical protein